MALKNLNVILVKFKFLYYKILYNYSKKILIMKNYSILIVDDEDAQRSILKGYLEKKGYKIQKTF